LFVWFINHQSTIFFSHNKSTLDFSHQSVSGIFLLEQISISYQPPADRKGLAQMYSELIAEIRKSDYAQV
jgi:hypothetical protein